MLGNYPYNRAPYGATLRQALVLLIQKTHARVNALAYLSKAYMKKKKV